MKFKGKRYNNMLKNSEIELMIKMENIIGKYSNEIFGENKDKVHTIKFYDGTEYTISNEDFIDYWNLIEKCIQAKKERARKQNERNKRDREYHRITNNITTALKNNDSERLEKYRKKLDEHNNKKRMEQAKEYLKRNGEDK